MLGQSSSSAINDHQFLLQCRESEFIVNLRTEDPEKYLLLCDLFGCLPAPGPKTTLWAESCNFADSWYEQEIARRAIKLTECSACTELLRPSPDFSLQFMFWLQFINVLVLEIGDFDNPWNFLSGGRGQISDGSLDEIDIILCHECAHKFCETFPRLGKLMKPEHLHNHVNSPFDSVEFYPPLDSSHVCHENGNCCLYHMWWQISVALNGESETWIAWRTYFDKLYPEE